MAESIALNFLTDATRSDGARRSQRHVRPRRLRSGARELGLSVPKDVSVVGIDDIVLAGMFDPPLTTVHHPIEALSLAAVDRR